MLIYIDCETIPSQADDAKDALLAALKPPAQMKLAATIDKWWMTEADTALDEQWRRQALDGGTVGEIISIAISDDGNRQFVRCRRAGESEAQLLTDAFAAVEGWTNEDARQLVPGLSDNFPLDDHHVVAHNAQFDLGFLWRRATVHGVPRPRWLPGPMARPGRDYTCTMQSWAGYGQRISLDSLCRALGVPSPKTGDIDGSTVFDAWLAGEYARIEQYNTADTLAVREVYHRILGLPRSA